jgi:hypothetical protein
VRVSRERCYDKSCNTDVFDKCTFLWWRREYLLAGLYCFSTHLVTRSRCVDKLLNSREMIACTQMRQDTREISTQGVRIVTSSVVSSYPTERSQERPGNAERPSNVGARRYLAVDFHPAHAPSECRRFSAAVPLRGSLKPLTVGSKPPL